MITEITDEVNAWYEKVVIPTYGIGKPEKNPMFLEKRVYQGSSGVVYPHPVIEKIEGRIDDILKTPDGRLIGRMDPLFKGIKGIYETQIIQLDKSTIKFKIVRDHIFNKKQENKLIYEIRKRVGNEMKIEINYVREIPKDKNGKFRAVISHII